jgi:hypothetical protein
LFNLADGKVADDTASLMAGNPGQYLLMKEDPRLPKMPSKNLAWKTCNGLRMRNSAN